MRSFRVDGWMVDPSRNLITRGSLERALQPLEMDLLVRLAEAEGQVVSKRQLLDDVWGERFVVEHVLPKTVSSLRRALGESARRPRLIQTVPRRGYRVTRPVSGLAEDGISSGKRSWSRSRRFMVTAAAVVWLAVPVLMTPLLPPSLRRDEAPSIAERQPNRAELHVAIQIATSYDGPMGDDSVDGIGTTEFLRPVSTGEDE